jgi:NhaP-type Na+/H+ and K+/H+ antiporter
VSLETFVYGLIFGVVVGLLAWRLGLRRRPWREAVVWVLLYTALLLALKTSGIIGGTESITIAFIAATLLSAAWQRFAHRPA